MAKPSQKALDTLIDVSEQYNDPYSHYQVILQLSTLDAKSVSFAISKLQEKNEYGKPTNKLNTFRIRNINVGISKDPSKYEEYKTEIANNKVSYVQSLANKFNMYIKDKSKWNEAMIIYIDLMHQEFFKNVIDANKDKPILKEWLAWYKKKDAKLEERMKGGSNA